MDIKGSWVEKGRLVISVNVDGRTFEVTTSDPETISNLQSDCLDWLSVGHKP